MTKVRFSQPALRLGAGLGLALLLAGCVSAPNSYRAQDETASDGASQAQRMLCYCKQLHEQGDHYVATGVCKKAFELDQTNPEPLHRLAQIMTQAGSLDRAAEAYYMALHLDENDVEARYGLSKAYMSVGRHDLAIPHLQAALAHQEDDYRLYNAMGISLDQQGRHKEAQDHYHQGLALAPTNPALHNNLNLSLALSDGADAGLNANNPLAAAEPAEPAEDPLASAAVAKSAVIELKTTAPSAPVTAPEPAPQVAAVPASDPVEPELVEPEVVEPELVKPELVQPELVEPAPVATEPAEPQVVEAPTPDQTIGQASVTLQPAQGPDTSALDQDAEARISQALPWVRESSQSDAQPAPEPQVEQLASAPEATDDGPLVMVQVGSYLERATALEGWQVISESAADLLDGLEPRVVRADAGADKGIVYRLRTGPLSDRDAGNSLCAALTERGFGCFVVQMSAEELAESGAQG